MTSKVAGIVFDLDGTLVDSRADIAAAANFALREHGYPACSEERIGSFVGDGATRLMARAARLELDSEQLVPLMTTFLGYYTVHACVRTKPMPGAVHALDALTDLPLALLTNKPRSATDAVLGCLGWSARFACVIAGGDLAMHKPDPSPLFEIARRLEAPSHRLVIVGDGPQDVECGRNAGSFTVGVAGGIAAHERLVASRPDRLIGSLEELPALIRSLEANPSFGQLSPPSDGMRR